MAACPTPSSPPNDPPASLAGRLGLAIGLFSVALLLLLSVASFTQRLALGPLGLALTELLAILLPAVAWMHQHRHPATEQASLSARLLLHKPWRVRRLGLTVAGGVLFGLGYFYLLATWVEPLCERILPVSPREHAHLLGLLRPTPPRPLLLDLTLFALIPALCEELLFRGVLFSLLERASAPGTADAAQQPAQRSLRGRRLFALAITSILFGAFHLSVGKLLPTAVLGLGFGLAMLASGSLYGAMAMHATNNAAVIVLVRLGLADGAGSEPSGSWLWTAGALLVVPTGLWLLRRAARTAPAEPPGDGFIGGG